MERMAANQFKAAATEPFSWLWKAEMLKRGADHLFDIYHDANTRRIHRFLSDIDPERSGSRTLHGQELEDVGDSTLAPVYFLLIGYSFENLLKGKLFQLNPHLFKPAEKMDGFNTHDLPNLATRVGFEVTPGERAWLKELTNYILWQGKYPIPLQYKDDCNRGRGIPFKGRETQDELDTVWARLAQFLLEQP